MLRLSTGRISKLRSIAGRLRAATYFIYARPTRSVIKSIEARYYLYLVYHARGEEFISENGPCRLKDLQIIGYEEE